MDISFKTKKLQIRCNSLKDLKREWGDICGGIIRRRLDDLKAAPNLEVMRKLPGRCHELVGDKKGTLTLDLKHPLRLWFEPNGEGSTQKFDGGLDWAGVTAVCILGVIDTHE